MVFETPSPVFCGNLVDEIIERSIETLEWPFFGVRTSDSSRDIPRAPSTKCTFPYLKIAKQNQLLKCCTR